MSRPAALGKGLGALINPRVASPNPVEESGETIQQIALDQIVPSPLQPRQEFPPDVLAELVASIRELGIIQPLIVRRVRDHYELIAGERRWRAAREVGLADAPAIVREATDREVLEQALVENLQREDLNAIEEALAYARLSKEFGLTQEDISKRVGKSRASVANAIRLLDLDAEVQGHVKFQRLSVGHAKILLSLKSHDEQRALADLIIRKSASVRAAEKLVQELQRRPAKAGDGANKSKSPKEIAPALQRIQNLLQHRLATRVVIHHGEKQGTIHIEYYGRDDLDRILSELSITTD